MAPRHYRFEPAHFRIRNVVVLINVLNDYDPITIRPVTIYYRKPWNVQSIPANCLVEVDALDAIVASEYDVFPFTPDRVRTMGAFPRTTVRFAMSTDKNDWMRAIDDVALEDAIRVLRLNGVTLFEFFMEKVDNAINDS